MNNLFKHINSNIIITVILIAPMLCKGSIGNLQTSDSTRPNILLIVSDDNTPDLGCYGNHELKTPILDKLAKNGVLFENAYATYSVCSPARSTIFTGLYPHQNGQVGLATHKYRMYPGITSLPVYLKKVGYRTGCIGKIHVNPESAIPFDFRPPKGSPLLEGNFGRKKLSEYASLADSFFRESNKPFFLMVNYPDPHWPFIPQVDGMPSKLLTADDVTTLPWVGADSRRLRSLTANYYNCIERLDEMIGQLLRKLESSGKYNNTLIIYLADQGPQFSRGKCSNYVGGLYIPLIVSWPGHTLINSVKKQLVSEVDLLPTILKVAHSPIPAGLPGKPLDQLLLSKNTNYQLRKYIFADGAGSAPFFFYPRRSVQDMRFLLIHNLVYERVNPKFYFYINGIGAFGGGTDMNELLASSNKVQDAYGTWARPTEYELYDLKNDPYEFHNLSSDSKYNAVLKRLKQVLSQWQQKTIDPLSSKKILNEFTAETDSVNKAYPNYNKHLYTKDSNFSWRYPQYFSDYIKSHEHK